MANLEVNTIVRAWRDEDYFDSLDLSSRSRMPAHPAGIVGKSSLSLPQEAGAAITLLNDNCNLTIVGPDGC